MVPRPWAQHTDDYDEVRIFGIGVCEINFPSQQLSHFGDVPVYPITALCCQQQQGRQASGWVPGPPFDFCSLIWGEELGLLSQRKDVRDQSACNFVCSTQTEKSEIQNCRVQRL